MGLLVLWRRLFSFNTLGPNYPMKISVHLIPIPPPDQPTTGNHDQSPGIIFHYTTGTKLKQIINSGIIRPSTAQVPPHEKPVVWCSSSCTWEPTATKCPIPGKIGQLITAKAQAGLARIALPATCAPHDLRELSTLAGTTPETCMALLVSGLELGSDPSAWRFSMCPIPTALFRGIELFDFRSDQWRAINLAELASRN